MINEKIEDIMAELDDVAKQMGLLAARQHELRGQLQGLAAQLLMGDESPAHSVDNYYIDRVEVQYHGEDFCEGVCEVYTRNDDSFVRTMDWTVQYDDCPDACGTDVVPEFQGVDKYCGRSTRGQQSFVVQVCDADTSTTIREVQFDLQVDGTGHMSLNENISTYSV